MASRKNQATDDDQKSSMGIGAAFPAVDDRMGAGTWTNGYEKDPEASYQSVPDSVRHGAWGVPDAVPQDS